MSFSVFVTLVALVFAVATARAQESPEAFDVLLTGGSVLDGSGSEAFRADVGIRNGRIVAVGDLEGARADQVLDARGRTVVPGFIDMHSHAELDEPWGRDGLPFLMQGITTVVMGVDGGGVPEVAERFDRWRADGLGVNALAYVGHGYLRRQVVGMDDRAPTDQELARMKELVGRAMEEGALGLSTGLFYTPGYYAETEEVIELGRVAARWDGAIYDTHDRDLGATYGGVGYDASVAEAIRIGEESGLRVIFSHFNPQGAHNYGRAHVGAAMIEDARARGVEVWAAHHPYTATQSNLRAYALPRWAAAGGSESVTLRLQDPDTFAVIRPQMEESLAMRGGGEKILFADADPGLNGKTLADVAGEWGLEVPEAAARILVEKGNATVMNLDLYDLENTRYLAGMPWMMTCTDGRTPAEGQRITHPRVYGAFPRKLRLFALEEDGISVPFAVRSMSGLAADFLRLPDRGYVREGAWADLAVIDLEGYRDQATFEHPHRYAEGVVHVLVNGVPAVRDGRPTEALAGVPVRRDGSVHGGGA
jgi:N-acyl-D-amino-acid deacylase